MVSNSSSSKIILHPIRTTTIKRSNKSHQDSSIITSSMLESLRRPYSRTPPKSINFRRNKMHRQCQECSSPLLMGSGSLGNISNCNQDPHSQVSRCQHHSYTSITRVGTTITQMLTSKEGHPIITKHRHKRINIRLCFLFRINNPLPHLSRYPNIKFKGSLRLTGLRHTICIRMTLIQIISRG